ncbi:alpha-L-fucosidase [uncultured Formosa sp.]|uniref:alpha-L-fucosidase n=1 Tax=uncultured Formosa sp. TaxID=255435 RepID=UPI0026378D24|nr:alpha-L-fucosidase [uncultured Formosa sp.]
MKNNNLIAFMLLLLVTSGYAQSKVNYLEESEADFSKRMQWFTDAKYGMFVHFGLYSQLGGIYKGNDEGRYAEWIQGNQNIPSDEYAELINTWNPKDFDADEIVKLAKKSGMKYLVITTKHHEGFCLWDSEYTDFDIANSPMKGRDLVQELADACKKESIVFGTYYSITDWHQGAQYVEEGKGWGMTQMHEGRKEEYVQYLKNQIKELIVNYDSNIIWFDADWVDWWTLEDGKELYQYIRALKPSIIINNRVAKRKLFKKDFGTPEQFHLESKVDYHWEACYTLNDSWGFKIKDTDWKSPEVVYEKLKDINGKGGNFLLNIGPDGNGNVPKESAKILKEVGKMLAKEDK